MLLTYFLSNSSSSSSDSSDSDSDSDSDSRNNGKQQIKKSTNRKSNIGDDNDVKFENLINNTLKNKPSKNIDIKINVANRDINLEKKIFRAANKVTTTHTANRGGILSSLLESISDTKKRFPVGKRNQPQFVEKNKHQTKTSKYTSNFGNVSNVPRSGILHELKQGRDTVANKSKSISKMLLDNSKNIAKKGEEKEMFRTRDGTNEIVDKNYPEIFTITDAPSSSILELKTWEMCEANEIKLSEISFPENGFQEMARWTEEGKLWKFPIDNEQGMEEEHNVHFSKHVFLEHHLTGWCPTKGPIRHFMELVCIGLSKNPYITVEEKYEHIMWYKEYFQGKSDLLQKLGIGEITPQNTEKQNKIE
ncbi:28S ribosomal protein S31, mitochondrial isoform X2 [Colletes gigas]|uniref:28S ribosomal protein S31, mitochondrial isoform X2 n=1 Tax=Colletes gigas TaxID=935657 RepID=UPI001C9B271F|nr:28S ribosomal protein S31, mitochondrial isoform X2 [Colletes gigas]